jgi:hypothetical protein
MKVVQDNFENLAASLMELQAAYEAIPPSDRAGRMAIRRIVIEAKTKARWASRRAKSEAKRAQKQEMVDWMLTWLENPPVFETWVNLRMAAKNATSAPSQ